MWVLARAATGRAMETVNAAGKEWENEKNGNYFRQFDLCAGRCACSLCRGGCTEEQITSAGNEAYGQADK